VSGCDKGYGEEIRTSDHSIACMNHCRNRAKGHVMSMYFLVGAGLEIQDPYMCSRIECSKLDHRMSLYSRNRSHLGELGLSTRGMEILRIG